MNYNETLEYIHSVNWVFCKPGLERIGELCSYLGDPQKDLKFIHVAGTNGKGSFCSMLSSVLRKAGLKVGLYTSPFIRFFNERMCIDGEPISNEELAEITTYVRPFAEKMKDAPTEFELITAVAFEYFKRGGCDVVVLEAGMGGRLDSTNIIDTPILSVITGIALDHTAFLGDTVEKIAAEKAGIIKKGVPVLWGGDDEDAWRVISEKAREVGSECYRVDHSLTVIREFGLGGTLFDHGTHKDMRIKLLGAYQPKNAANVINAVDILRDGEMDISEEALREGLSSALWQGRFEIIDDAPLTIFDGAHNPQGIEYAVRSVKDYFGEDKVYLLTGVLKDKDYTAIAGMLSEVASRAFTITPPSPRALKSEDYAIVLQGAGIEAEAYDSIEAGLAAAREAARLDGRPLVILGSLYLYAELIKFFDR